MYRCAGHKFERPFIYQGYDSDNKIYDLKDRNGFHCRVEVLCEPVEEEFGPEETFKGGCYLVLVIVSMYAASKLSRVAYRWQLSRQ